MYEIHKILFHLVFCIVSFSCYSECVKKRIILRFTSIFIPVCAVLLFLLLLIPTAGAFEIIVNASYDGGVGSESNTTWIGLRNAYGDTVQDYWPKVYSGMTESTNETSCPLYIYKNHYRGLVTWDTSDIPDDATITSAVISVYGVSKMNEIGTFNFSIIDASPSSKTAYIGSDYHRTTFTRFADDTSFDSFQKFGWNNITLNSYGLADISKTGFTTFMFTHSADVDNTNITSTWVCGPDPDNEEPASGFYFAGITYNATGEHKPFITINYDTASLPELSISASPTTVTAGTPTNVDFTVRDGTSVINGASVTLIGAGTGGGTTGTNGIATISVNAESAGIITATASMTGYTSNTTTVTANPPLPILAVSANPAIVSMGIPTNVKFTVKNQSSGFVVNGATIVLTGVATGSNTTGTDGNATISVNAGSTGTITATANMVGYTSNTTTVTVNPVTLVSGTKIGVYQNGAWYLDWNGNGAWDQGIDKQDSFGAAGWKSVVGDWNPAVPGTKIGVYKDGAWYLDWNGNGAWDPSTDKMYSFGAPLWTSVVGKWS